MTDTATFKTRFPEFSTTADARVQLFLDDAALHMDSLNKWLTFYDVAQAYYAAHLLVVASVTESGDFGTVAPLAHQEVDEVVIKNAIDNVSPTAEDLYSTSYGKRYVLYRRKCLPLILGV